MKTLINRIKREITIRDYETMKEVPKKIDRAIFAFTFLISALIPAYILVIYWGGDISVVKMMIALPATIGWLFLTFLVYMGVAFIFKRKIPS